jgi:hypothetical protein
MLISTKAGGVGLTLTGADRAVIYNPSWNPTDDSQAVDRCYRIGQTRPVEVYRFIAAGTVEEKTYEKQIFKDGINRFVTSNKGLETERYFDKNELSKLFNLAPAGKCELLEKLYEKGRIGDVSASLQKSFFDEHPGVIGLSSHDAVYQEKVVNEENEAPFGGSSAATPNFKVLGKAQRALDKKARENKRPFQSRENIQNESEVVDLSSPVRLSRTIDLSSPAQIFSPPRKRASLPNFGSVEKVVVMLRDEGRHQEALNSLIELLDMPKESLTNDQRLWTHNQVADVSSCLGWI